MSHHYIRFSDVHYSYPHGPEVLCGVDLLITHGEHVALLGLNGSGKSTLLLQINGLLLPSRGEVTVGDIPVTKKHSGLYVRVSAWFFRIPTTCFSCRR